MLKNLAALMALLLMFGCSKIKPHTESPGGAVPNIAPTENIGPSALFPHPAEWGSAASHGDWVKNKGRDACLSCHALSSFGKSSPPSCRSCHAVYPHVEGWKSPDVHGQWVLKNGRTTCASQCHGLNYEGGLSNISCSNCHTIYPHPENWNKPTQHGAVGG
ncbi:MAG: hypothetical protein Q7S00_06600, partial [bacterium]|nr:hypothetical protein [bacterium]